VSDSIPPELVDKMMVKCGRRCCICRRFRPTKLQVHHIMERGQGGGNEEDNLIVACFSCHSDVHTKVPFARRFSIAELKGHRDALIKMVEEGKLPADDTDDADQVMLSLLREPQKAQAPLSSEATEILLRAVNTTGVEQGSVLVSLHSEGLTIKMGDTPLTIGHEDRRTQAKYNRAIKELVGCGLLERASEDVLDVTDEGYLAADEIMVSQGQPPGNS
jgi:hypothetical protein